MATVTRPTAGYTPSNPITNSTKYQLDSAATAPRVSISSVKVDGDLNKAFDTLSDHDDAIVQLQELQDPVANLSEATITAADSIVFADASDSNALKRDTLQGAVDLIPVYVPIGVPLPYLGTTAPANHLMMFGQAVSRSTYSTLFAVIGTVGGIGDGSTTFNIPDLRGRGLFGKDDMGGTAVSRTTAAISGVDGATLGAVGGDQRTQQHSHTATVTDPGHTHLFDEPPANRAGTGGGSTRVEHSGTNNTATSSATTGITVSNANFGEGSSQNMPPAMVVNWIIRYQ